MHIHIANWVSPEHVLQYSKRVHGIVICFGRIGQLRATGIDEGLPYGGVCLRRGTSVA